MKDKKEQSELNVKEYPVARNTLYCLKSTWECYPGLLMWCLCAVLINVALPVLNTYLPMAVIDALTTGTAFSHLTAIVLAFMLGIALLSGGKKFVEMNIFFRKLNMNTFYTRRVAQKGMSTDYCNQENECFRKLQSESYASCHGNYSPLTQVYDVCVALLSDMLGVAVYFGILARLNILVVLFLVATTFAGYFLNRRVTRWVAANNGEKISCQQRTGYINGVSGDVRSAKDIRLYNMSVWFDRLYADNMKRLAGWQRRYATKVFGVSACDGALSLLREGAAYAYLLYMAASGSISVAEFALYFGAVTGFSAWLSGLLGELNSLNRISLAVNHLRAYLEYPERYRRIGGREPDGGLPKVLELKNVSYRYEGAQSDTLHNVNLTIQPGEHLAIVGLNGAGKTTLVKLLCGLTDPTEGTVLYDGVDVREYNRESYYRLFSAVFQQFSVLPVSIAEAVAEDVPERADRDRVDSCLKQAGLWGKIDSLPNGIDSELGRAIHDDGIELSGGETQKLLLARALYRDAPVMALDEPTAALDPISESRLYETYDDVMKGRSTVFISHRLASTRFCDRILLLDGGSVLEEGTHESLLAAKGEYYALFETQAKYYRENPDGAEVTA